MDSGRTPSLQPRDKTFVCLWTSRQFQQEQVEWDDVNKLLQHHGFKPVHFADPGGNTNISDLIVLDKKSAGEIRMSLRTMLTDSERRQALIQELIKSNNQLKEEVHQHTGRASQQSQRVSELEGLLDVVRTRVQDLEDRYLSEAAQQHGHTHLLQQERKEAQKQCEVLEQKLSTQREEAAQLQRKLYFTIREQEQRLARQSRTFQNICKRVSQQQSPADQQVLDVIDFYETKMTPLLDELRAVKGQPEGSPMAQPTGMKEATPSFKTVLQAYQEQQKRSHAQAEELQREVERLKQDLEKRPSLRDVKFYKHKLRRLEGSKKHKSTRSPNEDNTSETKLGTIFCPGLQLLKEIRAAVTDSNGPFQPSSVASDLAEFHTVVPTLEAWAQQLRLLKDLQRALNRLTGRLMPWKPRDGGHTVAVKVEDMLMLVDSMLENTSAEEDKVLRSPTRYTLGSMVSHFQKLFDVSSLSGVYPRMNEVYSRLEEMRNIMRNLRDVLQLDSRAPAAEVVHGVERLVSSTQNTAGFQSLLGEADIDSIILKVKQHDDFFPAFHALIVDMLQTLGVSHLGDVLPAVESLKPTAQ